MIEPDVENLLLKARNFKIKIADEISEKILKLYSINKTLFNRDDFDFKYKYNSPPVIPDKLKVVSLLLADCF